MAFDRNLRATDGTINACFKITAARHGIREGTLASSINDSLAIGHVGNALKNSYGYTDAQVRRMTRADIIYAYLRKFPS